MKTKFLPLIALIVSCSKTLDTPITTTTGTTTNSNATPTIQYTITSDSLSVLTTTGAVWNYMRIDNFMIDQRSAGSNSYGNLNWPKSKTPDTIYYAAYYGAAGPYTLVYKDTSYESITSTGRISYGSLVNKYGANYSTVLKYLRDSLRVNDTVSLCIWQEANASRNTLDTCYVFLSPSYFAVIPASSIYIYGTTSDKAYGQIAMNYNLPMVQGSASPPQGYISQGYSLLYTSSDTSCSAANTFYPHSMYVYRDDYSASGNQMVSSENAYQQYVAKNTGLLKQSTGLSQYLYMFGTTSYNASRTLTGYQLH